MAHLTKMEPGALLQITITAVTTVARARVIPVFTTHSKGTGDTRLYYPPVTVATNA
jgi:hypothetical protein